MRVQRWIRRHVADHLRSNSRRPPDVRLLAFEPQRDTAESGETRTVQLPQIDARSMSRSPAAASGVPRCRDASWRWIRSGRTCASPILGWLSIDGPNVRRRSGGGGRPPTQITGDFTDRPLSVRASRRYSCGLRSLASRSSEDLPRTSRHGQADAGRIHEVGETRGKAGMSRMCLIRSTGGGRVRFSGMVSTAGSGSHCLTRCSTARERSRRTRAPRRNVIGYGQA